jgi:protein-S-isoprenylcysteine O-methyltransferase Ste14
MWFLTLSELVLCATALAAFSWGMACFFEKPSGHTRHTIGVAIAGLGCAGAQVWAIAASTPVVWRGLIAILLYVSAISLFFWAVRACRQRLTAIFVRDEPRMIVREGPYRHLRHPFYTAYILFWSAGWIASGSCLALVSAIVMSSIYVLAAAQEEAWLRASSLAAEYADYCRRTGFRRR